MIVICGRRKQSRYPLWLMLSLLLFCILVSFAVSAEARPWIFRTKNAANANPDTNEASSVKPLKIIPASVAKEQASSEKLSNEYARKPERSTDELDTPHSTGSRSQVFEQKPTKEASQKSTPGAYLQRGQNFALSAPFDLQLNEETLKKSRQTLRDSVYSPLEQIDDEEYDGTHLAQSIAESLREQLATKNAVKDGRGNYILRSRTPKEAALTKAEVMALKPAQIREPAHPKMRVTAHLADHRAVPEYAWVVIGVIGALTACIIAALIKRQAQLRRRERKKRRLAKQNSMSSSHGTADMQYSHGSHHHHLTADQTQKDSISHHHNHQHRRHSHSHLHAHGLEAHRHKSRSHSKLSTTGSGSIHQREGTKAANSSAPAVAAIVVEQQLDQLEAAEQRQSSSLNGAATLSAPASNVNMSVDVPEKN